MPRIFRVSAAIVMLPVLLSSLAGASTSNDELLKAREMVWRAWFAGDTKTLEELVPPETIVMSGGEEKWKNQADVLRTAVEFHATGGKLVRLEFPRTEVQHFGDVAIVWSSYVVETEVDGKRSSSSGRVTEIFVWQHGRWTNPGWHTDSTNASNTYSYGIQKQRRTPMTQEHVVSAQAYYKAMNDKDLAGMERRLHPDVRLVTPMEDLTGKAAVLEAAKRLMSHIKSIEVHAKFESEDQAMLTYNMDFGEPIGVCRVAALMTFKDGLIVRNELFFDTRPFEKN